MNHKSRLNFEQFDNVVRKQKETSRTEEKQKDSETPNSSLNDEFDCWG